MCQIFSCIASKPVFDGQQLSQSKFELRPMDVVTPETEEEFVILAPSNAPETEAFTHKAIELLAQRDVEVVFAARVAGRSEAGQRAELLTSVNPSLPEVIATSRQFYDSCCVTVAGVPTANEILTQAAAAQVQILELELTSPDCAASPPWRFSWNQKWIAFFERFPGSARLLKFGCVGASGVVVDLGILALVLWLGASSGFAAMMAIWTAMSWNFLLNRRFTFSSSDQTPVVEQYGRFCFSCLLGATVNWSVRVALLSLGGIFADSPYLASLIGIIAGTGFNFCLCSRFVFRHTNWKSPSGTAGETGSTLASENESETEPLSQGDRRESSRKRLQIAIILVALPGAIWATSGKPATSQQQTGDAESREDVKPAEASESAAGDRLDSAVDEGPGQDATV